MLLHFLVGTGSVASYSHFHSPSLPMQRFQALSTINQVLLHTRTGSIETNHSRIQSLDIREEENFMSPCPSNSDIGYAHSQVSSVRSFLTDNQSWISDQASTSDAFTESSSGSQVTLLMFLLTYFGTFHELALLQYIWLELPMSSLTTSMNACFLIGLLEFVHWVGIS